MRFLIAAVLLCGEVAAQPRGVELFGSVGVVRGTDDEGSLGAAAAYGGAVTIPFARRWAVDVQVLTSRPASFVRRVAISPGVQYRRGNDRALWFIAFGPGGQWDRFRGPIMGVDVASGGTLHWRTGVVVTASKRLLIRGEFIWVNRYVLPDVGAAVSIGVRLGR